MRRQWRYKTRVGKDVEEFAKQWEEEEKRAGKKVQHMKEIQGKNQDSNLEHTEKSEQGQAAYEDLECKNCHGKAINPITGAMTAKIIAVILLILSCFAGLCGTGILVELWENGAYTYSLNKVLKMKMLDSSEGIIYRVQSYLARGELDAVEGYCREYNIDIELIKEEDGKENILWSTWNGYETDIKMESTIYFEDKVALRNIVLNGHKLKANEAYVFRCYIDPSYPKEDYFKIIAEVVPFLYHSRYGIIGITAASILICVICFLFLMCSAGHRTGYKEIVPGILTRVHSDVLAVLFGAGECLLAACVFEVGINAFRTWELLPILVIIGIITFGICLGIIFFMDVAIRVKMGRFWRHTLIYEILLCMVKMVVLLGRVVQYLLNNVPTVIVTMTVCLGISILEFFGILIARSGGLAILWILEKMVVFPVILYIALTCKRLLRASQALAEGQDSERVDTSRMFGDFKKHGENLNSLGKGISIAVAERMKSEHLKTELITNVSHDIKTPLTSIINYADLICEETAIVSNKEVTGEDISKISEYAEVLLRQSRRLKKLLEDLVEASKATTGNLEMNPQLCEAGVILSQAVGEYQKKMEEKGLELIVRQPEEPVKIIADGRHLWRVFDNLLNNICKYAQENSRVYLSVESENESVRIIFRNMSKYPLEIPAEELKERFSRGDKSRHMEGNGLGLAIAGSLMELQNGRMDIVTDGDLFKVILQLPRECDLEK